MNNSAIWTFLKELLARFGQKNPKFFNILAWIAAIAWIITGLPGLLEEVGITIPEQWNDLKSKIVSSAGVVVVIMANLAVQRPVITTTQTGSNTVRTDPKKLPFTAAAEKKEQRTSKES